MIFYTTKDFINSEFDKNTGLPIIKNKQTPFYIIPKKEERFIESTLNYILYLFDRNNENDINIANNFLIKVLDAQITDSKSDFYGTWLYSFNDITDDLYSPDYSVQSAYLILLIEIYLEFSDYLSIETIEKLKNACLLSAFTISNNNIMIDSPNCIIDIISLICTGEQFDSYEYINSGIVKLQTVIYYTLHNNAVMEYNYPGKALIILKCIRYFKNHIRNQHFLSNISSIENILLICFYSHFNPKLMQWTGPHSVSGSDFMPSSYIEHICQITNITDIRNFKVPPEYIAYSPESGEKFIQKLLSRGFSYPHWKFPIVASFYNTSDYSLGSFNREDLWGMRHPIIAYFGTSESPYCIRVRCLVDGYDFSSGTIHTVQHKNNILGHITFSTNRGKVQLTTDYKPMYNISDLRIRFQIKGDTKQLECTNTKKSISILYKKLLISYSINYSVFDNKNITYKITKEDDGIYFDAIIYSGENIILSLSEIEKAVLAFSLSINKNNQAKPSPVKIYFNDGFIYSEQKTSEVSLKLKSPEKPNIIEYTTLFDRQYINDIRLENLVTTSTNKTGQYRFIANNKLFDTTAIFPYIRKDESKYLDNIKNLHNVPLEKILPEVKNILKGFDKLSLDIAKRYSINILTQLFESAKKSDVRFKNIIKHSYSDIYNDIEFVTKSSQLKKVIPAIVGRVLHDYQNLLKNTKKSDKIARAINIINENFTDPNLSLQEIAEELNVSQAHFSREFHATMGESYVQYLLKRRIEHAKKLLADDIPFEKIIIESGYISDVTFNAAFKRYTGTTVKKYKASLKI